MIGQRWACLLLYVLGMYCVKRTQGAAVVGSVIKSFHMFSDTDHISTKFLTNTFIVSYRAWSYRTSPLLYMNTGRAPEC